MPSLTVIPGTPAPDTPAERSRKRRAAIPRPVDMLQCPRCTGREVIQTKIGVLLKDGKPQGGTKALLCAACYMRGERVTLA